MMAYGSVREDSIGTCTLCKMWAKVVVTVIKEYAKEVCLLRSVTCEACH